MKKVNKLLAVMTAALFVMSQMSTVAWADPPADWWVDGSNLVGYADGSVTIGGGAGSQIMYGRPGGGETRYGLYIHGAHGAYIYPKS